MEITINFAKPPRKGRTATLLRCHSEDKADVDKAADIVGVSTSAFMRIVILQAARTIIADGDKYAKAKNKG